MEHGSIIFGFLVVVLSVAAVRWSEGPGAFRRAFRSGRAEMWWLALFAVAFAGNWAVSRLTFASPVGLEEGAPWSLALIQGLQSALPADLAVPLFSFVYLVVLPALLITVPLTLMAREETSSFRTLCLVLSISFIGLVAMHLVFHSIRPSLVPGSGVAPLLYGDPWWGQLSQDLGSRGNSFPSGHTTIVTAMLVVLVERQRVRVLLVIILALIAMGVLYLGLHWPLDVVGGMVLGSGAALAARAILRDDQFGLDRRGPRI